MPRASSLSLLLLAAAADAQPSPLRAALDSAVRDAAGPSFAGAVLVARDGRVVLHEGYGGAARDTLFDVASVSKQFTATAVLLLESRGRLSVHDTLGELLRDVPGAKACITLHQLLTHTSGLPGDLRLDDHELDDRDAMLARVWREPLLFPPGDAFSYSNTGYSVLAAVIEKVTHQPFDAWIKRRLFRPAGMHATGFPQDSDLDAARAAPRFEDAHQRQAGDTAHAWPWHWAFRGASGVITTVGDLYAWDRALAGDRILGPRQRARLQRAMVRSYAYGWTIARTARGTTRQSHDGRVYGFRSVMARYPDENAVVIIAGNTACDVRGLEERLAELLFAAPADGAVLAYCVGRYRLESGDELEVARRGDRLVIHPVGPEATARVLYGARPPRGDRRNRRAPADRALAAVQPLARRSERALEEHFAPDVAGEAASTAVDACRALAAEHGPPRRLRLIGSRPDGSETFFRLELATRDVTWRARWDGDRLASLEPADGHPFALPLSWRHGHVFAARSADGFNEIIVSFTGRAAAATRLRWADRSSPEERPLVGRRR